MRHQHRSRNSLPGDIAQKKKQIPAVVTDKIAIIPADRAGSLVMVKGSPAIDAEVLRRKQRVLNQRDRIEIFLESALFLGIQTLQAVASNRIFDSVVLDRLMTLLTYSGHP